MYGNDAHGVVLSQIAVQSQQHEGELTVAPRLIEQGRWKGVC